MLPGVSRRDGRRKAAEYARDRRLQLGLTQPEVAEAAGVKDVKTIRNVETGRNWPNDLTKRGIETARQSGAVVVDRAVKLQAGTFVVQVGKRKFARVTLT